MKFIRDIVQHETFGGILLFSAGILALLMDNSPLSSVYDNFLSTNFAIHLGTMSLSKPLLLWINDGFMALYFLLIGLEIKREIYQGVLQRFSSIALPGIGALGGLIVPALIYSWLNWNDPVAMQGWAIPTATDIAFSLGILMLLGNRVPISLKVFLATLAIFDDIAAILIIAVFYTADLSLISLLSAAVAIILLTVLNRAGVKRLVPYCIIGIILWLSVLKSGVHATLAGIVLAFAIPLEGKDEDAPSPLVEFETALLPWATFLVLPLFAFANAGISFTEIPFKSFFDNMPMGIAAGLIFGKQFGIFLFCWLFIILGFARLPAGANWKTFYGTIIICGVGFTMSLFISSLAFPNQGPEYAQLARFGVFVGSVISGVMGYCVLRCCTKQPEIEH